MTAPPSPPRATHGRSQRILKTSEFRAVYAARARAGDGRLVVYARANGLAVTRLGVSVGKRCGDSVRRNRIKRLIREAGREPVERDTLYHRVVRDGTAWRASEPVTVG
jgi:ribonuclease P protein component